MSSKLPLIEHVAGQPSPLFAHETSKIRTQQFKRSQFWAQIVGTDKLIFDGEDLSGQIGQ